MILLLCSVPLSRVAASGSLETAADVAWSQPPAITLQAIGQTGASALTEDAQHVNYDCTPATYHYTYELFSEAGHTGCFVETAFGMMDIMSQAVIGNGFSGAVALKTGGTQVVVPITRQAAVATISGAPSGSGAYMHLYPSFAEQVSSAYDSLFHPYLQMPAVGSVPLNDPRGQPLLINPQTIAYSSDGSWMVMESPWHAFVRVNLATLQMLPFAPSFTTQPFDYSQHNSQVAITDDGRYVAIENNQNQTFKVYDLANCSGTNDGSLRPLSCPAHEYWRAATGSISGFSQLLHLRFVNDGSVSYRAYSTGQNLPTEYELAPDANIPSLLNYLALGDSYTSGEGSFDYRAGTATAINSCHQSMHAYPALLDADVFNGDGRHSAACSGAVIDDLASTSPAYRGQIANGHGPPLGQMARYSPSLEQVETDFLPGYIPQQLFVKKYRPGVVTVSIGGNDAGFGDILTDCVMPHLSSSVSGDTCYNTYEERTALGKHIDSLVPHLASLYRQLHEESPASRIYAIGYPQIITNGSCGLNVQLNSSEIEFAQEVVDRINNSVLAAAKDANVSYVDISRALVGHRLCETESSDIAMNGLTAGRSAGVTKTIGGKTVSVKFLGAESFHPNALGQELIEQAILHATHNFHVPPAAPPPIDTSGLLSAPKSGRVVGALIADDRLTNAVIHRGDHFTVHLGGQDGLAPGTPVAIHLHDGPALGTLTTDGQGSAAGSVTVPPDTPGGPQIIDASGTNQAGQPITVTQPVFISPGGNDDDSDGITNNQDSCPTIANSGVDEDHDGTDDICDPHIGTADSAPGDTAAGDAGTTVQPPTDSPNAGPTPGANGSPSGSLAGKLLINNKVPTVADLPLVAGKEAGIAKLQGSVSPQQTAYPTRRSTMTQIPEKHPSVTQWPPLRQIPWVIVLVGIASLVGIWRIWVWRRSFATTRTSACPRSCPSQHPVMHRPLRSKPPVSRSWQWPRTTRIDHQGVSRLVSASMSASATQKDSRWPPSPER